MTSTSVILIVAAILLVSTVIPGIRLYWPQRRDPVSRTDLGVALMTGALIAFAVLALQILVELRAQNDATQRQREADRQALLLLLGRQRDLSGLDLHEKNISGAYLVSKVLRGANLAHTNLSDASLEDANLVEASLGGATLDSAHLDRADLRNADLSGASLVDAKLNDAQLDAASLSPEKDGNPTNLSGANLSNAFVRSDLRGAVLVGAHLVGARLSPANLEGANLEGADLQFADLRGADLRGAKLADSLNLDQATDLAYATYNRKTTWPANFSWAPGHKCARGTCTLLPGIFKPLPTELKAMRDVLRRATQDKCLEGWRLAERPRDIEVVAPRNRARFAVTTAQVEKTATLMDYVRMSPPNRNALHIESIRVGRSTAYAERFFVVDKEEGPVTRIAVYFKRGAQGYKLLGSAAPPVFSQFERDFDKLFRVLNVHGHLFQSLRGDEVGCAA